MKRKIFLCVVMVLIAVLSMGIMLTACNNKKDKQPVTPPEEKPVSVGSDEAFTEVVDRLDEVSANNGEFAFALESKDSSGKVMLGLAFEKIDGEWVMYASAGGSDYVKYHGFDLGRVVTKIVELVTDENGQISITDDVKIKLDAEGIKSLSGLLVPVLFGEESLYYGDDVISMPVALNNAISFVKSVLTADKIASFLGLTTDNGSGETVPDGAKIDALVNEIAPAIFSALGENYEGGLAGVYDYLISETAKLQINAVFSFGSKVTDDSVNPFASATAISDEVRKAEPQNLVKFAVDATAKGYVKATEDGGEDTLNHTFDLSVDADIDVWALLDLLYSAEKDASGKIKLDISNDRIVDMLKKLGYIDIRIDEVSAEGELVKNILRVWSDTAEGYAIAQFSGLGGSSTQLGGLYDFGALVDYVGVMKSGSTSSAVSAAQNSALIDTVGKVLGFFSLGKGSATVQISDLLDFVADSVDLPTIAGGLINLGNIVRELDGESDYITVSLDQATFGECRKVSADEVKNFIATKTTDSGTGEDTTPKGFAIGLADGATLTYNASQAPVTHFVLSATGFKMSDGTEWSIVPILMGVDYDPSVVGQAQTVTAYIGAPTALTVMFPLFGEGMIGEAITYPMSGIIAVQFEVTIPA